MSRGLQRSTPSIDGEWHLLPSTADEVEIPSHRVDFLFRTADDRIHGAVLAKVTGDEIPLANLWFDGPVLQLQMRSPRGKAQDEMPTLVMQRTASGDFEGEWLKSTTERLPWRLKLVRSQA